jgi:hypothetical protein
LFETLQQVLDAAPHAAERSDSEGGSPDDALPTPRHSR